MANTINPDAKVAATSNQTHPKTAKVRSTDQTLSMDSFMKLLVQQLTNQDMMNPMDDTAFMAQLTQMATVEAMNTFTDVTTTTYAASLVGKEVTVAKVDSKGEITEICGTVTGAALYGGQQVIFVDGESYYLTQIMAVGKLPPPKEEEKPVDPDKPTDPEKPTDPAE